MKKFKLLFLVVAIISSVFYSCSDDSTTEEKNPTESIGLRTVLNEIKKENNITGKSSQTVLTDDNLCFDFVYPITLSYNNGTTISVTSFEGLIQVLTQENENLYITGIAFPFQVVLAANGSIVTINNEDDFWNVIDQCEIATFDDFAFSTLCYDFVYPFSLVNQNNQTIVISNQNDLLSLFTNPNSGTVILDFVYPFSVIYENETIVINDAYEFFELNNECFNDDCVCPAVYDPVCVNTPNGVEEFPNACFAECLGYTAADFVNCNGASGPSFSGLGTCYTVQYPIQVQSQGAVFTVNNNTELLGYLNSPAGAIVNYPIVLETIPTPALPISVTVTVNNTAGLNNFISTFCN